jgi:hypothetical protein
MKFVLEELETKEMVDFDVQNKGDYLDKSSTAELRMAPEY